MRVFLEALLTPPGLALWPLLLGLVLWRRRAAALGLIALSALLLYALSSPLLVRPLVELLEGQYPPLRRIPTEAQAIVVLGAGRRLYAPEFGGGDTVNAWALERLRYAAWLQRRSGLPLMAAGGGEPGRRRSEAELSRPLLEAELGVPVTWLETTSLNTYENAREAARILRPAGIRRVIVVTHAMHMPRAVWSFRRVGLEPIAAPTAYAGRGRPPGPWPDARAQAEAAFALHELWGLLYYRLRY